jgi:hypothetical protein
MIDNYSFGSITIKGKTYSSDVIIYPERVNDSWWRKEGHNLSIEDIQEILDFHPEALIIGTGNPGLMKVPGRVADEITSKGIELHVSGTGKAVLKFNELCTRKRTVAALHLTC